MSILLGNEILDAIEKKQIIVSNFNKNNIGPNSMDVTLGNKLLTYVECKITKDAYNNNIVKKIENSYGENHLDMAKENKVFGLEIPDEGLILQPNILYLGHTNEKAGSDFFVPMYEGRSSLARLGFLSHISAGFGDIFFKQQWTLEITVVHPLKIYPNSRIGQVYFHRVNETARKQLISDNKFYNGKYVAQEGPQSSKSYLDFKVCE